MEQAPTFRAVVFDLYGTLVDTVGDLTLALNRTLADLGLPPHAKSTVRGMVGGGLAKLLEWALPPMARPSAQPTKGRRSACFTSTTQHIFCHTFVPLSGRARDPECTPGCRDRVQALHQ